MTAGASGGSGWRNLQAIGVPLIVAIFPLLNNLNRPVSKFRAVIKFQLAIGVLTFFVPVDFIDPPGFGRVDDLGVVIAIPNSIVN